MFLGGFFNKISRAARAAREFYNNSISNVIRRVFKDRDVSRTASIVDEVNIVVEPDVSLNEAAATLDVNLQSQITAAILERGKQIMKDSLRPVTRTGKSADSIQVKQTSPYDGEIITKEMSLYAMQTGFYGRTPPPTKIISWLNTKPEHSGKTDQEKKRLAYAIRSSFFINKPPGDSSTIKHLVPRGERAYYFVDLSVDRLNKEIDGIIKIMAGE